LFWAKQAVAIRQKSASRIVVFTLGILLLKAPHPQEDKPFRSSCLSRGPSGGMFLALFLGNRPILVEPFGVLGRYF